MSVEGNYILNVLSLRSTPGGEIHLLDPGTVWTNQVSSNPKTQPFTLTSKHSSNALLNHLFGMVHVMHPLSNKDDVTRSS